MDLLTPMAAPPVPLVIERARRGDEAAFADLVERHRPLVRGVLARSLSSVDMDDAEQAVYLVLHRRLTAAAAAPDLAAWLHRTAVLIARNARRHRTTRAKRETPMTDHPEPAAPAAESSQVALLLPHLDAALDELPADQRAVVIGHHLQGRPLVELAAALGIPANTAYTRAHRGLERLRRVLARHVPGSSAATVALVMAAASPGHAALPPLAATPSIISVGLANGAGGKAWVVIGSAVTAAVLVGAMAWMMNETTAAEKTPVEIEHTPDASISTMPLQGWLGVVFGPNRSEGPRRLPDGRVGRRIDAVEAGSAAAVIGLRPNDYLLAIDGSPIPRWWELHREMEKYAPGDVVSVAYLRDGEISVGRARLGAARSTRDLHHPLDALAVLRPEIFHDDDPLRGAGWTAWHHADVVEHEPRQGMRSLRLRSITNHRLYGSLVTRGPIGARLDQLRGRRVRFSADVRSHGSIMDLDLWVSIDETTTDHRRGTTYRDRATPSNSADTGPWQRSSVVVDVDANLTGMRFGVDFYGVGDVLIASPLLEVVGPDIPTTLHPEVYQYPIPSPPSPPVAR